MKTKTMSNIESWVWLIEKQLETIKIFYERKLLTKEQYEYEIKVLTTKIDIKKDADTSILFKIEKSDQNLNGSGRTFLKSVPQIPREETELNSLRFNSVSLSLQR